MERTISPLADMGLRIRNFLVREASRPDGGRFRVCHRKRPGEDTRTEAVVTICSVCNRCALGPGKWTEVDRMAGLEAGAKRVCRFSAFAQPCPDCIARLRNKVLESGRAFRHVERRFARTSRRHERRVSVTADALRVLLSASEKGRFPASLAGRWSPGGAACRGRPATGRRSQYRTIRHQRGRAAAEAANARDDPPVSDASISAMIRSVPGGSACSASPFRRGTSRRLPGSRSSTVPGLPAPIERRRGSGTPRACPL